ncbi:hypothetical protein [Desulfohalovibrio reitneri]|uniref:hypothetical protein n=1 Tax=Desulfohalovibrio reitneri TaxID=1307759 RepID=UPI0004A6C969|nr:hypothetical protein [Desulfohalovibrio reitneri]
MILGHAATAALGRRLTHAPWAALLLGAFAPDLMDKPLGLLGLTGSRAVGHTGVMLLAAGLVCLLLIRFHRLRPATALAFLGMWIVHLAGDLAAPRMLFWPLLGPLPQPSGEGIWAALRGYAFFYLRPDFTRAMFWLDAGCLLAAGLAWWPASRRKRV